MHILHVVGARPNFMKVAPVMEALKQNASCCQTLVHTGQHYDANMTDIFFRQLALPIPDIDLGVGSGSHAQQTAQIMMRFEPVVLDRQPDLVLVYGDVNSTVAAALVCAKLLVPVGHVEAGLRSHDRTMPEEINRLLTDKLADWLFTPSADGNEHLQQEGIGREKIHLVGNVMIDTLIRCLPLARQPKIPGVADTYALITLHRPANVDQPSVLHDLLRALLQLSRHLPVVFPVHPRTRQSIEALSLPTPLPPSFHLLDPLGYLEFLALQQHAMVVITDSGGIQEETTYLGVPCLTLRENTERPITVNLGSNILIGRDMERMQAEVRRILAGQAKSCAVPPLWDGKAAERIATVIQSWK
jgi:UDP-N-acetylglucosamine 2-epimerase (non-hydrolysing)